MGWRHSKLIIWHNKYGRTEICDAGYIDIHFLCKYIKVNAIEMFLQQNQFSNEDKKKLLQYSKKVSDLLFVDEIEIENLDGNYFVDKDVTDSVKFAFLSTGKISELKYSRYELSKYIGRQLKEFLIIKN